jgi:hypothetical protein
VSCVEGGRVEFRFQRGLRLKPTNLWPTRARRCAPHVRSCTPAATHRGGLNMVRRTRGRWVGRPLTSRRAWSLVGELGSASLPFKPRCSFSFAAELSLQWHWRYASAYSGSGAQHSRWKRAWDRDCLLEVHASLRVEFSTFEDWLLGHKLRRPSWLTCSRGFRRNSARRYRSPCSKPTYWHRGHRAHCTAFGQGGIGSKHRSAMVVPSSFSL